MAKRTRRRHSAEQKAEALKKHHLEKQDVSTICEEMKLNPSLFYTWQRTLFANAGAALDAPTAGNGKHSRERELEREIAALKAKLVKKDEVIAEISAEYVELKKELGEP
jgi:transposase-like protein